jgi:hypothetical protein
VRPSSVGADCSRCFPADQVAGQQQDRRADDVMQPVPQHGDADGNRDEMEPLRRGATMITTNYKLPSPVTTDQVVLAAG